MATKAERDAAAKAEADKAAADKAAADKAAADKAAADKAEADEKAKAVADAKAEADERAKELAEEQREAIARGEDGQAQADQAREAAEAAADGSDKVDPSEVAQGHTITAPKDAPVDYAAQTLRRPPQRVLPPRELSGDSFGGPPVVSLPYGSEPRSIDPATGGQVKPEPKDEDVHGDDQDADVDAGGSAAQRAAHA